MGIFDRLSTLIRSNINDLINRAENPEKMVNQLIVDMRSQLAKAKQLVAAAIADEKRLSAQVDTEKKSAEDWERRAVLAVQEGRDDLAKQALLRHNEHAQGAVQLHETWVKHREETEKLKLSLRQLNDRIEEAKRKKNILIARQKRAEAHKRIQETMSSIGDKSAFETFEKMAEQIEHEERKLIAAAEVNEDLSGDTLVKQFQSLEVKADADQQLLDLKRKMGLLPAGSPAEAKRLGKGAGGGGGGGGGVAVAAGDRPTAGPDLGAAADAHKDPERPGWLGEPVRGAAAHRARQSVVRTRGPPDRRRRQLLARLDPSVRDGRRQAVHRERERGGDGAVPRAAAAPVPRRHPVARGAEAPHGRRPRPRRRRRDAARLGRGPAARHDDPRRADGDRPVGAGRALLARLRHLHGPRRGGPVLRDAGLDAAPGIVRRRLWRLAPGRRGHPARHPRPRPRSQRRRAAHHAVQGRAAPRAHHRQRPHHGDVDRRRRADRGGPRGRGGPGGSPRP